MRREIDVDGSRWRVVALPDVVERAEGDDWHLARVRFEPLDTPNLPARETWLRLEEDVPAHDVLDQYEDEQLVEAYLVAEEVDGDGDTDDDTDHAPGGG